MPRTDENGRQLKALLDYLLDGELDAKAIYDALGVSSSTYYRRIKDRDYPNAEELRQVADRFGLNCVDLQIRFGLLSHHEVQSYLDSAPLTVQPATDIRQQSRRLQPTRRLPDLALRDDAPPL
ncbi:transcriptional regulator [Mycolicibacterium palauense]|uniref:transcriptional regulator n=1 Tax=Mycolicibacterium palauense TaxID=2034511 RepID=UPI000BFEBFD1|nr:transcriptional regulator [Mycolicibacterium palauense]